MSNGSDATIKLPAPSRRGRISLEAVLAKRRSVREFRDRPMSERQLSQLLWATQGVTDREGDRTAPSAGALFPLEIYVATPKGVYHYVPASHRLTRMAEGDLRKPMFRASLRQEAILEAAAVFVVAAVFERVERHYGEEHGPGYVYMEVGHAAQNLLLQAVSLGLGAVPIAAFDETKIHELLGLPEDHDPVYLVPVGKPG